MSEIDEVSLEDLISEALSQPHAHIAYFVGRALARLYPDRHVLFGRDYEFRVAEFARRGRCQMVRETAVFGHVSTSWRGAKQGLSRWPESAVYNVLWEGNLIDVLYVTWHDGSCRARHHWVIADSQEAADAFLCAVSASWADTREEVMVFEDGSWEKSEELYDSIKNASLEKVVLAGELKTEILKDLSEFFASREVYAEFEVPWKRGMLFIGPPGNGKTGLVKALVNELKQPCLYVKSFDSGGSSDQENIRDVFTMARRVAPCILVFEDIDSLIKRKSLSFFLNEMDGFASNSGLAVIATTNHAERLDPAILDRPSRFDRKFFFDLPAEEQRIEYFAMWNETLKPPMRLTGDGLKGVAAATEGFSFAFLKELCMSSITEWLSGKGTRPMDDIAARRATLLLAEIANGKARMESGAKLDSVEKAERAARTASGSM